MCGLRVESEVRLPGILPSNWSDTTDVSILEQSIDRYAVDTVDNGLFWRAAEGFFRLDIEGVARFAVIAGERIIIEAVEGASHDDISTYLYGSVMGALLHQRKIWPFHASAIQTPSGAVLLAGKSGAGKSTLVAGLFTRGYQVISDDIAPVHTDSDQIRVYPAIPRIKLKPDAINYLAINSDGLKKDHNKGKYLLPLANFPEQSSPVTRIIHLDRASNPNEFIVNNTSAFEAVPLLVQSTYRYNFMKGLGVQQHFFSELMQIVQHVPVTHISRPRELNRLNEVLDDIEAIIN